MAATLPPVDSLWELFYRVIRRIPRGRVATYGAVAERAGKPRSARHVGYALAALRSEKHHGVPWQRVVGARGRGFGSITIRDPIGAAVQRQLLEKERVRFDERGRISLEKHGWKKR
jgi:methylated-DNA-protein-cysteine methyltransferase-like protein